MEFESLNLDAPLLEGVLGMGYKTATPIQAEGIPTILEGHDLIGCAQTGTGKTAAFIIPLIQKLHSSNKGKIRSLILVPTRELTMQIDQQVDGLGYFCDVSSYPIYGGNQPAEFDQQKAAIRKGADIIIATPGRFISHLNLGYMDLSHIEILVLDEADRMLDMGFIEDITKIINYLPKKRQTLLFSATMSSGVRKLSNSILNNPKSINLAVSKPAAGITQQAYMVYNQNKIPLLQRLIKEQDVQNMIIFASRKSSVDEIVGTLKKLNLDAMSIHSGRPQEERNETMRKFKSGSFRILVATDILSRGIDIDGLSHVLNFDIPDDAADYVHRIGRTARADKTGMAISFINDQDQYYVANIEKLIEREIPKSPTPEDIGASPSYDPHRKKQSNHRGGSGGKWRGKGGGGGNKYRGKRN